MVNITGTPEVTPLGLQKALRGKGTHTDDFSSPVWQELTMAAWLETCHYDG